MSTLLGHPPFLPDESLFSRLIRLARINGYDTFYILLSLIYEETIKRGDKTDPIGRPMRRETYEFLSTLTYSEVADLYSATPHIFSTVLIPPDYQTQLLEFSEKFRMPVLGLKHAHGHLLPDNAGQFCPMCLEESSYHRLNWKPVGISVCLKHQCFLINKCYICGNALKVADIVSTFCSSCEANLKLCPVKPAMMDAFGLFTQHTLYEWFMRGTAYSEENYQLPKEPINVLYRVLTGLRLILLTFPTAEWPYLTPIQISKVPPSQNLHLQIRLASDRYQEYRAAFKVLVDWPQGFFDFLDVCRSQSDKEKLARRRGETEFGNIYSSWIKTYWKHSAFTFLQEAFDLYVFEKYSSSQWLLESHRYREHPQFAKDLKLIGVDEAAKILGVAFKTVKFFLRTKQLTNYKEHNERYYVREELVSRAEVLALRDKLKDRLSIAEVSSWLGTNYHIINDLIEVGLLVPEPRMKSEKCASQGVLTKSTVIAGVERIVKHVKTWTGTELQQNDFLDLALAAQIAAATLGLNTAKLLLSVSEGKLRAYCRVNSSLELNNLIFSRTDIQSWIDSIRAEKNWMIQEAAVDFLGVKHETFINWIELGFISPVAVIGTKKYFDRLSIEQFRHDYVPSEEAAHILGIRLSCLYQWMKRGWLDGIFIGEKFTKEHHSYYLFNREHLVKWRNERVNADEAARLLGINREALRYLVRKGKLNPLPKMGTHPYWFSRKDVLQRNNRKD